MDLINRWIWMRDSLTLTLKYKPLWVFGFLAAFVGMLRPGLPTIPSSPSSLPDVNYGVFREWLERNWPLAVASVKRCNHPPPAFPRGGHPGPT